MQSAFVEEDFEKTLNIDRRGEGEAKVYPGGSGAVVRLRGSDLASPPSFLAFVVNGGDLESSE